jgi:glycosyltransferase involved in cell wall biosynthesis
VSHLFSSARAALRILATEGLRSFVLRVSAKLRRDIVERRRLLPVREEDLLGVDPLNMPQWRREPLVTTERSTVMSWLMSPPSPHSGGHQNLFRFVAAAERAGHRCNLYFYTATNVVVDSAAMRRMIDTSGNYPRVSATMQMYDPTVGVGANSHALIATGWETAYPVFRDAAAAQRFYFVQDFEPAFYPWGSEYFLAEDTYRFGFHGLTAGGWLSQTLTSQYGMQSDHFDFSVDHSRYFRANVERRHEVFFYARPATARRGFEIGVAALREFHRRRPGTVINFAGEFVRERDLGFPVRNHSALALEKLNALYNQCAAGLVLSATNMSLLPLELLAAGVIPIVNDAPNNRLVSSNPSIVYAPARPAALADALIAAVDEPDQQQRSSLASRSVLGHSWEDSGKQFLDAYQRVIRG